MATEFQHTLINTLMDTLARDNGFLTNGMSSVGIDFADSLFTISDYMNSNEVDGPSAVGFPFNTNNQLLNSGSKLFQIKNNGVEVFAFKPDGVILVNGSPLSLFVYAAAAPTTGAHVQNEIIWDVAPVAGGAMGWVCVESGTPGVWKSFGLISL